MRDDSPIAFFVGLFLGALLGMIAFCFLFADTIKKGNTLQDTVNVSVDYYRTQAIAHGAAEYDSVTGEFQWIEQETE